jgi:hypothetical protein
MNIFRYQTESNSIRIGFDEGLAGLLSFGGLTSVPK